MAPRFPVAKEVRAVTPEPVAELLPVAGLPEQVRLRAAVPAPKAVGPEALAGWLLLVELAQAG
jgi:hypothetical protein